MFRSLTSSPSRPMLSGIRSLTSLAQSVLRKSSPQSAFTTLIHLRRSHPSAFSASSLASFNASTYSSFSRCFATAPHSIPYEKARSLSGTLEPLPSTTSGANATDPLIDRVASADRDEWNLPPPNRNESDTERLLRVVRTADMLDPHKTEEERLNFFVLAVFFIILLVVFPYLKVAKAEEMVEKAKAKNAAVDDADDEEIEDAKALKEQQTESFWSRHLPFASSKSSGESLLPPVSNDMFGRPMRTLVLSLHDVILHAEWRRMEGWRFQKRPHLDEFLQRITESGYEIVLWCEKPATEVEQMLQDLDPALRMKHRLFDDSMTREYATMKKNPELLSREARRTIILDYKPDHYHQSAAENILKMPRFEGDVHDDALLKVADILEKIQKFNVYDVSSKILAWNHQPEHWRRLFEQEEDDERATLALKGGAADEKKKAHASSVFGGILQNVKPVPNANQYQRI